MSRLSAGPSIYAALILASGWLWAAPAVGEGLLFLSADEAEQGIGGENFVLRGNLKVRRGDWEILGLRGVIVGPLGEPEQVVVDGAPATIRMLSDKNVVDVEGRCEHLSFEPSSRLVHLSGQASIVSEVYSVSSESIDYSMDLKRFSAGQKSRVKVVARPANSGQGDGSLR